MCKGFIFTMKWVPEICLIRNPCYTALQRSGQTGVGGGGSVSGGAIPDGRYFELKHAMQLVA